MGKIVKISFEGQNFNGLDFYDLKRKLDFYDLKKKLTPGVVLSLPWGYIHQLLSNKFIGIYLGSQVNVYRTTGLLFTIYGRGGHLGHVTLIIYIHIGSPFL